MLCLAHKISDRLAFAVSGEPCIAPLANHGGATHTHTLLLYSPLIGLGFADGNPPQYDQRGPGFARISGAVLDIGAYRLQQQDDQIYLGVETNTNPSLCPIPSG